MSKNRIPGQVFVNIFFNLKIALPLKSSRLMVSNEAVYDYAYLEETDSDRIAIIGVQDEMRCLVVVGHYGLKNCEC